MEAARPSFSPLAARFTTKRADKGVRVQAVLPGATAADFWGIAGAPLETPPGGIVMSAQDMIDAALAGLDQAELITLPSLPELVDWNAFEATRAALGHNLSRAIRAARYALWIRLGE